MIDKDAFESYYAVITLLLGTERTRRWNRIGKSGFDQGFVRKVDELLSSSGYLSYMDDIRTWDNAGSDTT